MVHRVHYSQCPLYNSRQINPLLTLTDFSVSGESFVVWQCADCSLRFTQDVPDAASIGPYYKSDAYISHTDTKAGLVNRVYQKVRTVTLQQKAGIIRRYTGLDKGRLLDYGAGTGAFCHKMRQEGWTVRGIEPDEDARKVAARNFRLSLEEPPVLDGLPEASFDAITLWHVLEHVHHLQEAVEHFKRLLAPRGKLVVAVPNYQSGDAAIYRTRWAAYDVPRHLYHFSPQAIEVLMRNHGLRVIAKKPMWFDAFYISLLSSKYKNGRINWPGAVLSGLRSNLKAMAEKDRCSSLTYIIEKA